MNWIKDTYLDFLVLLVILVFGFYTNEILKVVIWVYTILLVIGKVIAIFMPSLQRKADQSGAPPYIYHLIYGISVCVLLYIGEYYLGAAWFVIWGLSFFSSYKSKKRT